MNVSQGVIENLLHLVKTLGFVPNGSRVYYEERSQPPLLLAMAKAYYDKTHDLQFIRDNIDTLEQEFNFWMNNSMVDVSPTCRVSILRTSTVTDPALTRGTHLPTGREERQDVQTRQVHLPVERSSAGILPVSG